MYRIPTARIVSIAGLLLISGCSPDRGPTDPVGQLGMPMRLEVALAQPSAPVVQFGTSGGDVGAAIAVDRRKVAVAGSTLGTFTGQATAGGSDGFVRLYNPDGTVDWTRQFGSSATDEVWGVAIDGTGVMAVGTTAGALLAATNQGGFDVFVLKYDLSGNLLWVTQVGSSGDDAARGVFADAGSVFVVGNAAGSFLGGVGQGGIDAFAMKLDGQTGELVWLTTVGGSGDDLATGVAVGLKGVYVAASSTGTLLGGENKGGTDAFAVKLDPTTGALIWTTQLGTAAADVARGVAVGRDAVFLVGWTSGALAGTNAGSIDAFASSFDPATGEVHWITQFGTTGNDLATGATADRAGVFIAGSTNGTFPGETNHGETDGLLANIDPGTGVVASTTQFGSAAADAVEGIVLDRKTLFLVGETAGALGGQTNNGGFDAWWGTLRTP